MHGGRGGSTDRGGEMTEEMDKGNKDAMDPIMMEEDQIKKIMSTIGNTRSGVPYQYKMNNKKRTIGDREDLESNEEDIEDICVVDNIEEILHATYEREDKRFNGRKKRKNSHPCLCQCEIHNPMCD
jgi:hypothetical protein